MHHAIMMAILFTALCGCTISDGPFQQVRGVPIDYENFDQLTENRSTVAEALSALGTPTRREIRPDGTEVLEYLSAKRRESIKRTLGVRHGRETQTMEERVVLVFKDGALLSKHKESEIYENDRRR